MVHEQNGAVVRVQDERGAGDVAGGELVAGEGVRSVSEKLQDEFAALTGEIVCARIKSGDQSEGGGDHWVFVTGAGSSRVDLWSRSDRDRVAETS